MADLSLSPYFQIESEDFHRAWFESVYAVMNQGVPLNFGSANEPKKARDTAQTIILTGKAIEQIQNCETHPSYRMKDLAIQQYKKEYSRKWFDEVYSQIPVGDKRRFTYLYVERMLKHRVPAGFFDQIVKLKELLEKQIKTGISSNRHQMITWEPDVDMDSESPPCLQRIWIRWYPGGYVDIHFEWRSRDLFNAWQGNLIGLVAMLLVEVILPNNCKIARIVDKCDSLHIYEGSLGDAEKVLKEERVNNPDFVKKLEYKYT